MNAKIIMQHQKMNELSVDVKAQLIKRLSSLSSLKTVPRKELQWLTEHGHVIIYETGANVAPKGKYIDNLYIILSGKVTIRVDRGAGPRLVAEWQTGEVVGLLPYSRMSGGPGDSYVEEKAEVLAINEKLFPEMIHQCPSFTAFTVHTMLDRARDFNTSDLQDEKMLSLGKLAAGLAHELNNPASATVRDAKLLLDGIENSDEAWQALIAGRLSDRQVNRIMMMRTTFLSRSAGTEMSALQKADHQDKISEWLVDKHLDPVFASFLADSVVTIGELNDLAGIIPRDKFESVLKWMAASCSTRMLAAEMARAANQIYKLVDAVKKFTYMDSLAEKEFVDVEGGIRDTMIVLGSKAKAKNAAVQLEIAADLPRVFANGSDLNQVWYSLLDNALDAISHAGKIRIKASTERNRVAVCISDDGPGIAPDVLPKIFDPFFTTKPAGQGTGLGLDIARRLLRRYNADISVQSRPGRTEFRLSLVADKQALAQK